MFFFSNDLFYHFVSITNLVNSVQPDITVNTHYYIEDPTYAEALRKNAINLVSNGALHSNIGEPVSPLNSVAGTEDQSEHSLQNNMLNTISNNNLLTPVGNGSIQHTGSVNDSALLFGYASINGLTIASSMNHQIPPMPPLRSTNHLNGNTDKLLNGGYSAYATLQPRINNNLNNLNNLNNTNRFPSPSTLLNTSTGHLV